MPVSPLSPTVITPPASEPVSLAEARAYLRLDDTAEDALLATKIIAARQHIEQAIGRSLVTRTLRLVIDTWPESARLRLPGGPVQSVDAATVRVGGSWIVQPTSAFSLAPGMDGLLTLVPSALQRPDTARNGIRIDYAAGFGDAAQVPEPLRLAVTMLAAHWFDNRSASVVGHEVTALPFGIEALILPYRAWRL